VLGVGYAAGWLSRLRAAADELVIERVLLPEDADRIIAAAEQTDPFKPTAP